eukprot:COSAG05_NODE_2942_length_2480_cov_1.382192_1_plen_41_part_00
MILYVSMYSCMYVCMYVCMYGIRNVLLFRQYEVGSHVPHE